MEPEAMLAPSSSSRVGSCTPACTAGSMHCIAKISRRTCKHHDATNGSWLLTRGESACVAAREPSAMHRAGSAAIPTQQLKTHPTQQLQTHNMDQKNVARGNDGSLCQSRTKAGHPPAGRLRAQACDARRRQQHHLPPAASLHARDLPSHLLLLLPPHAAAWLQGLPRCPLPQGGALAAHCAAAAGAPLWAQPGSLPRAWSHKQRVIGMHESITETAAQLLS